MPWLKLDTGVFRNPDIMDLIDETGGVGPCVWMFALCSAKERAKGGELSDKFWDAKHISRNIAFNIDEIKKAMKACERLGLVQIVDGQPFIPNYEKHQIDPTSNERKRRWRDKQKSKTAETDKKEPKPIEQKESENEIKQKQGVSEKGTGTELGRNVSSQNGTVESRRDLRRREERDPKRAHAPAHEVEAQHQKQVPEPTPSKSGNLKPESEETRDAILKHWPDVSEEDARVWAVRLRANHKHVTNPAPLIAKAAQRNDMATAGQRKRPHQIGQYLDSWFGNAKDKPDSHEGLTEGQIHDRNMLKARTEEARVNLKGFINRLKAPLLPDVYGEELDRIYNAAHNFKVEFDGRFRRFIDKAIELGNIHVSQTGTIQCQFERCHKSDLDKKVVVPDGFEHPSIERNKAIRKEQAEREARDSGIAAQPDDPDLAQKVQDALNEYIDAKTLA